MIQGLEDVLGYHGQRVAVLGCYSGMGWATARLLLDLGAEVHGFDIRECDLPLASFSTCDLRQPGSIREAAEGASGDFAALFNCAGVAGTSGPLDVMRVNYIGTRRFTEAMLPRLGRGGAIASISSVAAMGWQRNRAALGDLLALQDYQAAVDWCEAHREIVASGYALSKEASAVWTMTEAVRLMQTKGVRMNCICPGPTQTPMMADFEALSGVALLRSFEGPIARRANPEEQAWPLLFLNSPRSSFVSGCVMYVDGGFVGGVMSGALSLSPAPASASA